MADWFEELSSDTESKGFDPHLRRNSMKVSSRNIVSTKNLLSASGERHKRNEIKGKGEKNSLS